MTNKPTMIPRHSNNTARGHQVYMNIPQSSGYINKAQPSLGTDFTIKNSMNVTDINPAHFDSEVAAKPISQRK